MAFLTLFAIPLLVAGATFVLLKTITWREFLLQVLGSAFVAGVSVAAIYASNTHDTEVWSGRVQKKSRERVSCSHSYRCNCRMEESCSGSGKDRSCYEHEVCDTCYEHSYDIDWDVRTSVGTYTINRVDRQGLEEPARWTSVQIGDPVATTRWYTNYVKAAPGSLFRYQGQKKQAYPIPAYPLSVYDYYKLDRLVGVNTQLADAAAWNRDLQEINAELGARKQVNIVVVFAMGLPSDYFYALQEAWIGGKKNDVVLVIGVDRQMKQKWARVMAWTTSRVVEVKLRDDIMALPELSREAVVAVLKRDVSKFFDRKPMADYEYLAASVAPTTTQWVVSIVLGFLVSIGLAVLMHREDVFGEEARLRWRRW